MPPAAGVRAFSEGSPNAFSQNLTRLTCEWVAWEMKPALAYGLNTRQGTRPPSRNWVPSVHFSSSGGLTWLDHPPESSHVTKIATFGHSPPFTIAATCATVQAMPLVTLPLPALRSAGVSPGWPR